MSSFTIRQYNSQDREQCRSLWKELTEWHREIYEDTTIGGEHPEDYFDKHLNTVGPDNLWVATDDSRVAGLTGLIVAEREAEIEPLVVSKPYRGRGIGKQLVEHIIGEARKRGIRNLKIKPVARNQETIRFLYKQGFKTLGFIELFMDFSGHTWKSGPRIFGCDLNY
jgi:GNAT superfamily N-acetyltransferase